MGEWKAGCDCELNKSYEYNSFRRVFRVKEAGIQKGLWKHVYQSKPKCTSRGGYTPLSMIDISPAIAVLIMGMCSSVTILAGEILYQKYRNQKVE